MTQWKFWNHAVGSKLRGLDNYYNICSELQQHLVHFQQEADLSYFY